MMDSFTCNNAKRRNEEGLTLVEVLVSVVLLSIIITIFLNVFIQAAKTNSSSEKIVDVTYLAQTEMEYIYQESIGTKYSEREQMLVGLDYYYLSSEGEWAIFKKELKKGDYYAKMKIQKHRLEGSDNLNRIILTIHNGSTLEKIEVQMESILVWEADAHE